MTHTEALSPTDFFNFDTSPEARPVHQKNTSSQNSERITSQESRDQLEATGWLSLFQFSALTDRLSRASEVLRGRKKPQLWSSERYFAADTLATSPEAHQAVTAQLRADLRSFFDEYALLRAAIRYDYGISGMRDGYSESMSEIAGNFTTRLKEAGKPYQRAEREAQVAQAVERWMANPATPVSAKLIGISPRGSEAEGYPGLDERNYIFINIFEKTDESNFTFSQFRSYEPQNKLRDLQTRLVVASGGVITEASQTATNNTGHQLITQLISAPPESQLATITDAVYATKDTWKTDIDRDLPKLSEQAATEVLAQVVGYCEQQFATLMQDENIAIQSKRDAFDQLITIVRDHFLKWVETHALNYSQDTQTAAFELDFDAITAVWLSTRKQSIGERLTPEESKLLKSMDAATQLSAQLPLKQAASWAHCIAGTPTSLMNVNSLVQVSGMPAGFGLEGSIGSYLQTLSKAEKDELRERLSRAVALKVNGETWYVPPEYLDEPGCYWSAEQQCVVGPCDIPLTQDPLVFSAAVYEQLSASLAAEDAAAAALAELTAPEQAAVQQLLVTLQRLLLVESISPEQFLQGEVLARKERFLAYPLLSAIYESLTSAINPLAQLLSSLIESVQAESFAAMQEEVVLFQSGVTPLSGESTVSNEVLAQENETTGQETTTATLHDPYAAIQPKGFAADARSQRPGRSFQFPVLPGSAAAPATLAA